MKPQIAKLIEKKLSYHYNKSPEANLMFQVFAQTLRDASSQSSFISKISAYRYLIEGVYNELELIGISSEYVKRVISEFGIDLKSELKRAEHDYSAHLEKMALLKQIKEKKKGLKGLKGLKG